ncbi:CtrA inhibitor SciP [Varunaivibrio sulfuroxidans]|nr:DUF1153 domain-containing protein [Varunaivibrio sulfuroxidans]
MKHDTSHDRPVGGTIGGASSTANIDHVSTDERDMDANELPPADTKRWVSTRKAQVVTAVRTGVITLEEACRRYALSIEEFVSWQQKLDRHGTAGLRVTHHHRRRG